MQISITSICVQAKSLYVVIRTDEILSCQENSLVWLFGFVLSDKQTNCDNSFSSRTAGVSVVGYRVCFSLENAFFYHPSTELTWETLQVQT